MELVADAVDLDEYLVDEEGLDIGLREASEKGAAVGVGAPAKENGSAADLAGDLEGDLDVVGQDGQA